MRPASTCLACMCAALMGCSGPVSRAHEEHPSGAARVGEPDLLPVGYFPPYEIAPSCEGSKDTCECTDKRVIQVAVGDGHSCALLENGKVRCWGSGTYGMLGYGNQEHMGDDETPADAGDVDVGGMVVQIATGGAHTCALLETGSVRCWGDASRGQLGYGSKEKIGDDETPASVGDVDLGGKVVQIATGFVHTCALLEQGSVRCWGSGKNGKLGYGHTRNIGDDETPASAGDVDVGGMVAQIAAGGGHTCALLTTGKVRCWGKAYNGELGYGNKEDIGDDETPASAGDIDIEERALQVSTGPLHTCVLFEGGGVRCWGYNYGHQLGSDKPPKIGDDEPLGASNAMELAGPALQIAAGRDHTCAVIESGNVQCWGLGKHGKLGYGSQDDIGDDESPAAAGFVDVGCPVAQVTAGNNHTCALLASGVVRCWGDGALGRLGYGNSHDIGDDEPPAQAGDVPVHQVLIQE